jgi:hypothetical protein
MDGGRSVVDASGAKDRRWSCGDCLSTDEEQRSRKTCDYVAFVRWVKYKCFRLGALDGCFGA